MVTSGTKDGRYTKVFIWIVSSFSFTMYEDSSPAHFCRVIPKAKRLSLVFYDSMFLAHPSLPYLRFCGGSWLTSYSNRSIVIGLSYDFIATMPG